MHSSYYKQDKTEPLKLESAKIEELAPIVKEEVKPLIKEIKQARRLTDEQREQKHEKRLEYHKQFYTKNKEEMLEKAKVNDKSKYWMRYVREARNNTIDFDNIKPATIMITNYIMKMEKFGLIWIPIIKQQYSIINNINN